MHPQELYNRLLNLYGNLSYYEKVQANIADLSSRTMKGQHEVYSMSNRSVYLSTLFVSFSTCMLLSNFYAGLVALPAIMTALQNLAWYFFIF